MDTANFATPSPPTTPHSHQSYLGTEARIIIIISVSTTVSLGSASEIAIGGDTTRIKNSV